jgi:4-amino-4-deoxy-L-arabinose transferase-like glycosyltransferase
VITAFAGALRFAFLDQQSFWFDEAVTVHLVRKSLGGMLGALPGSESTPPLYYVLVWFWSRVFGTGEVGLRALSALFGTATVPVAYALGRVFASHRAGVFAALLVTCSPFLIWYSQEARSYALLTFLVSLSVLAFELARRRPAGPELAGWAVVAALALATHYFAVFVVVAEAIWLLAEHARRRAVLVAVGAVAAAGAALLPLALHQEGTNQTWWITTARLSSRVRQTVTQFVSGAYTPPHRGAYLLAAATIVVLAAAMWRLGKRERRAAGVVFFFGAVTIVASLALAPTRLDKFFYRNLIGSWPLFAVGLATVLASLAARRSAIALVAVACLIELGALAIILHRPALQRDDWRTATQALVPTAGPLVIVTNPSFERLPIELYRPNVRSLPSPGVRSRELVFLGFSRLPLDLVPPAGFAAVEERRIQHIAFVRYRAPRPVMVRPHEIATRSSFTEVLWAPARPG